MKFTYTILKLEIFRNVNTPEFVLGDFNAKQILRHIVMYIVFGFVLSFCVNLILPDDYEYKLIVLAIMGVWVYGFFEYIDYCEKLLLDGMKHGFILGDGNVMLYRGEYLISTRWDIASELNDELYADIPQEGPFLGKNKFRVLQAGADINHEFNMLALKPVSIDEGGSVVADEVTTNNSFWYFGSPDWIKHMIYYDFGDMRLLWKPGLITKLWDEHTFFVNFDLHGRTPLEFMQSVIVYDERAMNKRKVMEIAEYLSYYPNRYDNTTIWEWLNQSKKCSRGNFYGDEITYLLTAIADVVCNYRENFHFPPGYGDLSTTL